MKNVLIVITSSHFGGAQRYVLDLATHLPTFGWQATVVCGVGGQLVPMLRQKEIEVIELPSLRRKISPTKDLKTAQLIRQMIASGKYDLVHANSSKAGLLGRLAAWMENCPSVFTAHGFVLSEPLSPPKKILYWLLELGGGRVASQIIAVSNQDRQLAINYKLCPPRKIITIHNGVNLKTYQDPKEEFGVSSQIRNNLTPNTSFVLGAVANFYPTKGHHILLPALSMLQKQGYEFECLLIGDGYLKSQVMTQARLLGLSEKVHFTGWRDDVPQILATLDLFVLPSIKEGFPFAILEAMASGLPIVATDVGGIAEVISHGQNGLLVPPKRADLLANAISGLMSDPKRRRELGERARLSVSALSVERMVAQTVRIYDGILSEKSLKLTKSQKVGVN